MKHTWQITAILLIMFVVTQLIGLAVIHADIFHLEMEVNGTIQKIPNPQLSWIEPPEPKTQTEFSSILLSIAVAFVIAVLAIFLLSKIKISYLLKYWFFAVVVLAIFLCVYAFEKIAPWAINPKIAVIIPFLIALPLAFYKIFRQHLLIHNLTELMIYPGIAAVFVPLLNIWTIIIFLIAISVYDIWAVWHSGFMQKMAKFQINKLKLFSGFFVPYASKKQREEIALLKQKYKNKKIPSRIKNKKIKISLAILGGGDVIFPIIAAGIFLKTPSLGILPALIVTLFASIALLGLFILAKKGKFYPAMPFLTGGIFLGMLIGWLISL